MEEEILRLLKQNNNTIAEIKDQLQSKKNISVQDILKSADLIRLLKQENVTYRSLLGLI